MKSPISSRTNAEPLTLDLLKKHVPAVKKGQEAIRLLEDTSVPKSQEETRALLQTKTAGSRAQETLIVSALPLIKTIASKEYQRRKAWSSRISYDDILQEAIAGFIRGLFSYDEETEHNSPTNYLGMWITTSIRRKVESLDHDFNIPYEVIERARRIRAVTGRLINELSRQPTDEEILDALNSPNPTAQRNKWGSEPSSSTKTNKNFTQDHLDEAKALSIKSYGLTSYETTALDSEETYEKASTPLTAETTQVETSYEEEDLARTRLQFFTDAFIQMKIGSKQQDIILRYFGMGSYTQPQTQKDIIQQTALPPRFVKAVITSFSTYMPTKGGIFHHLILNSNPELVEDLELAWLYPVLGEWPETAKNPTPPPGILSQTHTKTSQKNL